MDRRKALKLAGAAGAVPLIGRVPRLEAASTDWTPLTNWANSTNPCCGVGGPQCVQNYIDKLSMMKYSEPPPCAGNYTNMVEELIYQNGCYTLDGDNTYMVSTNECSLNDFLSEMTGPNTNNFFGALSSCVALNIPPQTTTVQFSNPNSTALQIAMASWWCGGTISPPTRTDWPRYGQGWGGYASDVSCGTTTPSQALQDASVFTILVNVWENGISSLKAGPANDPNYCANVKRFLLLMTAMNLGYFAFYIAVGSKLGIAGGFVGMGLAAFTAGVAFRYFKYCTKF